MTFDFEKEEPKVFVEEKMRSVFMLLEDIRSELRGYEPQELDEIKEIAKPFMTVPNRTMIMCASYIVDQCNYQKTMLRAAEKAAAKADKQPDWLDIPQPKEYR